MQKNDWLYPLTPERYSEIKEQVETKLFEEASTNQEYIENAWKVTVKNLESLFQTVVESGGGETRYTISVVRDDTLGQPVLTPRPTGAVGAES